LKVRSIGTILIATPAPSGLPPRAGLLFAAATPATERGGHTFLERKRAWQLFLLGELDLSLVCEHGPSSRDIEKLLFVFRVRDTTL